MLLVAALGTLVLLALAGVVGLATSSTPRLAIANISDVTAVEAERALLLATALSGVAGVPVAVLTELKEATIGGMTLLATVLTSLTLEAVLGGVTKAMALLALRSLADLIGVTLLLAATTDDLRAVVDVVTNLLAGGIGASHKGFRINLLFLAIHRPMTLLSAVLAELGLRALPIRMTDLLAVLARNLGADIDHVTTILAEAADDNTSLILGVEDLALGGMQLRSGGTTAENDVSTASHWIQRSKG